MPLPGNLLTTAMAVMPHRDVDRALEVALSLDVPFWPQLPNLNYYEDMYVQASEHFPGIVLDLEKRTLQFFMEKFLNEFEQCMAHFDDPGYFDISETYSVVYHRFLGLDLSDRAAIRGLFLWDLGDLPEDLAELLASAGLSSKASSATPWRMMALWFGRQRPWA